MQSRNIVDSFRFAFAGLRYAMGTQRNARTHLLISAGVIMFGVWLGLSPTQWAVIALTIALVLVGEMINTVAEKLVDLVCPGYHPLARTVKDLMAGTVLLAAIVAVIVGLLVLGPPLWQRLSGN